MNDERGITNKILSKINQQKIDIISIYGHGRFEGLGTFTAELEITDSKKYLKLETSLIEMDEILKFNRY